MEPPRRLTTWGNTNDLAPGSEAEGSGSGTNDIGNVLPTEANTMAGPTEAGEGTPVWDDESVAPSEQSSAKSKGKGKRKAEDEVCDSLVVELRAD